MSSRKVVRTLAAAGSALAMAVGLAGLGAVPAAAEAPVLELAVTGDGVELDWNHPAGLDNLAPGAMVTAPVVLSNERGAAVRVTVAMDVVADNDGGCTEPESQVDSTCAAGQGELSRHLDVALTAGQQPGDTVRLDAAADGIGSPITLDPDETRELTFTLAMPRSTGNIVQTDGVEFAFVGTATGVGTATTEPIAATSAGGSNGSLPFTGVTVLPLLALTLALLGAGAGLVVSSRRRRSSGAGANT